MKTLVCLHKLSRISLLLLLLVCGGSFSIVKGQIFYNFQQTFGTFSPVSLTGASVLLINQDDALSNQTPIGFTFVLDGVEYTQFQASSNGWIVLQKDGDPAITNNAANSLPVNNLTNPNFTPIIAPLWDDLRQNGAAPPAAVHIVSKTENSAPNRVLTVQWPNMRWQKTATGGVISFQVKLHETTNKIEFIYNNEAGAVVNASASIGITGTCPGDFYSLNSTGPLNSEPTPFALKTTETNNLNKEPGGNNPQNYTFLPLDIVPGNSNDLCSGAISLTYSTLGNCQSILGSVVGSTGSGGPPTPSCWTDPNVTNDVWFVVTKPAGKTTLKITTDLLDNSPCNTAFNTDIAVYTGSCGSLVEVGCGNVAGQNPEFNPDNGVVELTGLPSAATTYYIRVEGNNMTPTTGKFLICATEALAPGSTCSNPVNISTLPFVQSNLSTCGYGNDYVSGNTCTSLYLGGEDFVFRYTPTVTQNVDISLTGTQTWTGFFVTAGCPADVGSTCVATVTNSSGNPQTACGGITLNAGTTYYIIVDTWPQPACTPFNISVIPSTGAGPVNDQPCNATPITQLGTTFSGTNVCSSGTGEPTPPSCWGSLTGTVNTVWYSVVAPSTGSLSILATAGTLWPQIGLYSGACGSLTQIGCSPNGTSSGCSGFSGSTTNSLLNASGLTPGSTYYISVDGYLNQQGTFNIIVNDNTGVNPIPIQDCISPYQVCNPTTSFANPGFLGAGNICDYPTISNTCFPFGLQELHSAWITFTCNPGTLEFDIIANLPSADYDFMIWNLTAANKTVAQACSLIANPSSNLIDATMIGDDNSLNNLFRCNWATNFGAGGITGLRVGNTNTVTFYNGFTETQFNAPFSISGQPATFLLYISNWSANSGFTLDFKNSPIVTGVAPTSLTWTGQIDNDWFKPGNWGGCYVPTCDVSVNISGGAVNMPLINAPGAEASNITVQGGATLNIAANQELRVCGNFFNNGTLNLDPTSTILLNGTGAQSLSGSATGLSGTNKLGNLTINKASGVVNLFQNIDIAGNMTLSAGTFNTDNYTLKVAGNFTNNGTFGPGTSSETVVFNGTGVQNYSKTGTGDFYNVIMENTGGGVQLTNANMVIEPNGSITFTNGVIKTGTYELWVQNRASGAASTGGLSSYVEGVMRRYINNTGLYDFAVGHPTKGFQRLNLNFSDAGTIDYLKVNFQTHSVVPAPIGPSGECNGTDYIHPGLDNGFWQVDAFNSSNAPLTGIGTYTATLYNRAGSYTNANGNFWTVQKDSGTGYNISSGTCAAGTINAVMRTGMVGFSKLSTAQGDAALPVTMVSFGATPTASTIILDWQTAAEKNNAGFDVQRSTDNVNFNKIGWVSSQAKNASIQSYNFVDKDVRTNTRYYYRLRQVDFNGTASLSNIVEGIIVGNTPTLNATIYPNPTSGDLGLDISLEEKSNIQVRCFNAIGALVFDQNFEGIQGSQTLGIPTNRLTEGNYYLVVVAGGKTFGKNFVKTK